jgi:hypothetical protein
VRFAKDNPAANDDLWHESSELRTFVEKLLDSF